MSIEEIIQQRNFTGVLHFTTNPGLVGVLAKRALLSRARLENDDYLEHVLHVNAAQRPEARLDFDKSENWLDFVNLSISEINRRYLSVSKRWHRNSNIWWCILEFHPAIMTHENVVFATTNNSYEMCERGSGAAGLEKLFKQVVQRKAGWNAIRGTRGRHLPTCEQAEVLYPEGVSVDHLRRIYVEEADHYDVAKGWLGEFAVDGVEVALDAGKFVGCQN